jgi:outer membrane protein TolC
MRQVVAPVRTGRACAAAAAALLSLTPGADAEPLSLQECVQLALRNNLVVEQAAGNVRAADADVMGARAAFLPTLRMSASATRREGAGGDIGELTRAAGVDSTVNIDSLLAAQGEPPEETRYSVDASANLLLFDGLGNVASYQQASRNRNAARSRELDARQGVVYETERRFFEVLKTAELLDVQEEAANLSEEQLKKTRAMKELGAATQADVYKGEVDFANNRLEVLRAERNREVAIGSLATYLGLDPGAGLEVRATDLDLETDIDQGSAVERALELNPQLKASRSQERALEAGVTAAKSGRWPSVSAFYGANYFDDDIVFRDLVRDEPITRSYGLSMSIQVFDGLVTKSRIRRAQSDLVTARRSTESVERDVRFEVRQAWLDLQIIREAIRVSEEAVRSSEEDLRLAQERYKIGEGTILDVIDAQVNLTRSRSNLVNATYDRRLAVSRLHDAIGDIPVPPPTE